MSAADDVVRAWTDRGRSPNTHVTAQRNLRRDWPVLARAVEALVEEYARRAANVEPGTDPPPDAVYRRLPSYQGPYGMGASQDDR